MALYRLSAQVIKRTAGRSAVACAAYRSGQNLNDERYNKQHNYQKKSQNEGITAFIIAPENSPEWVYNREQLWNKVEASEKRKDAQLAREIILSLPVELSKEKNEQMVKEFVQEQFVRFGMVADVAMHKLDSHNPHCHIMLTLREVEVNGFKSKKNRDWNKTELLELWRERWADKLNKVLEQNQVDERVTHKSYKDQGIDVVPSLKLSVAEWQVEQKGIATYRGDINREIKQINQLKTEVKQLDSEIKLESKKVEPVEPTPKQERPVFTYLDLVQQAKKLDVEYLHLVPQKIRDMEQFLSDEEAVKSLAEREAIRTPDGQHIIERKKSLEHERKIIKQKIEALGPEPKAGLLDIFNRNKKFEIERWERSFEKYNSQYKTASEEYNSLAKRGGDLVKEFVIKVRDNIRAGIEALKELQKHITQAHLEMSVYEQKTAKQNQFFTTYKQVKEEVKEQTKTVKIAPTQEPKWGRYEPEPDKQKNDLTM